MLEDPQVPLVPELITLSGGWNEEVINLFFFVDIDVHAILSTLIGGARENVWDWKPEKHGNYIT